MKTSTDLPGVGTLLNAIPETMCCFGTGIRAVPPRWYFQLRYGPVNRFRSSGSLPETIETDGVNVECRSTRPQDRFPVDEADIPDSRFHDESENDTEHPMLETSTVLGETCSDKPVVGIGRDGGVLRLADGHHRLSLATLLDLEDIPVIVRAGWWEVVRVAFGSGPGPAVVPQKCQRHPGHLDLAVSRPDQFEVGVTA